MRNVFIGPVVHWVLLIVIVGVLYWLGGEQIHRLHFIPFIGGLLAITAAVIAVVRVFYRRGERVTREPIEDDE